MKPYTLIAKVTFSLTLAILAVHGTLAHAVEIRVLSSNGVHSVMVEMVPEFERTTGHKISISYDTANLVLGRIKAGEAADLIIVTRPVIDGLIKEGKIVAGTGRDLARSGVGVAIRAGLPKPDISTPEALKRALLDAKSITFTKTGASGSISPKWPSASASQTRSTPKPRYPPAVRSGRSSPAGKPKWRCSRSPNSWRCPVSSMWDHCRRSFKASPFSQPAC